MNIVSCTCKSPKFPNFGRPNCVIRKKKTAAVILFSRYNENGERNTIDLSSPTIGQDIIDRTQASVHPLSRFYVTTKLEEVTHPRTETAYQTFGSGRKFKLEGEGGVRSFSAMLPADDGVEQIARELQNSGCTDMDYIEITVDGYLWGVIDDVNEPEMRGKAISRETFDTYIMPAQDGQINSIMMTWDLEDDLDTVNSYAITTGELGYKANITLKPLATGVVSTSDVTTTGVTATVVNLFGSPSSPIVGLDADNFTITNLTDNSDVPVVSVDEVSDGVYEITYAAVSGNHEFKLEVSAPGYAIEPVTYSDPS